MTNFNDLFLSYGFSFFCCLNNKISIKADYDEPEAFQSTLGSILCRKSITELRGLLSWEGMLYSNSQRAISKLGRRLAPGAQPPHCQVTYSHYETQTDVRNNSYSLKKGSLNELGKI